MSERPLSIPKAGITAAIEDVGYETKQCSEQIQKSSDQIYRTLSALDEILPTTAEVGKALAVFHDLKEKTRNNETKKAFDTIQQMVEIIYSEWDVEKRDEETAG